MLIILVTSFVAMAKYLTEQLMGTRIYFISWVREPSPSWERKYGGRKLLASICTDQETEKEMLILS